MAQQYINIGGQPNDGTGDSIRDAFQKTNDNFTDVYDKLDLSLDTTYVRSIRYWK